MIRNYFRTAIRNIRRSPGYSILNISGMAIGMASAIMILLWVQKEWSYDRHFSNAENIFRLTEKQGSANGETSLFAITPGLLPNALKEEYPEIIQCTRYDPHFELRLRQGNGFTHETAVALVDKEFLRMFDVKFIEGDANSALDDPHNIVITEEIARKYFGTGDPLGKTLQESLGYAVKVTGVIKKLQNSHLRFDILVPVEAMKERGAPLDEWDFRCYNYIELKRGTDNKAFENKIRDYLSAHDKGEDRQILLQNIKKIHLYSAGKYTYDTGSHGDITYVKIMGLIAIFILIITCINFVNFATAQSINRAKGIGLRKTSGSGRWQIILQFLTESLLIILVAAIIAVILVEIFLPGFNRLAGGQLSINFREAGLYTALISVILFCCLAAGSYPAFYLSSLQPLDTVRGIFLKNPGKVQLRRVLIILQFSLSVLLIIATLIVRNQLNYIKNAKTGINTDNIGYFMFPAAPWDPKLESIKEELLRSPGIDGVTRVFFNYENPLNIEGRSGDYTWTGKRAGDNVMFYELIADEDYATTFKLELLHGRFFSREFPTDTSAVMINETAAAILGFKDPVGEMLTTRDGSRLSIIGVVSDFHYKPLHYRIEPLIMKTGNSNTFFIRMEPGKTNSIVESVNKTYKSFKPDIPLDFHFLTDDFNRLYSPEQRIGEIFAYFSLLAIIISCLGLAGLSSFITERRTREIGIRKVNGARSVEIFYYLSGEYILWVCISIIIACPVAWYLMNRWLQDYAYRINITLPVFLTTGGIALLIAMLTVSYQSFRAANKNPAEALRYE